MLTAIRRRRTWAIAASIAAHLGLLTAVLLQHPTLQIPVEPGGPPEAIIPLLILPRTPPAVTGPGSRPAPIQLHRRPQRAAPSEVPIAPLVIATPKATGPAPNAPTPAAPKETQPPPAPPDAVRATLRTLGCTDARLAGLSREDRAGCLERLGRGARDAPYLAPLVPADKRAGFEEAGAAKLAARAALERAAPTAQVGQEPTNYDGEPDTAHNTIAAPPHPPSKRAARVLPPLPR